MAVHFPNKSIFMVVGLFAYFARVQSQTADVIQMLGHFPRVSAVLSSTATNGEDNLECLRAVLAQYQPDVGNAAYVWLFRQDSGAERTVVMNITKGDSPEEVNVISSDDPTHAFTCIARYTDYKSCFVLEMKAVENLCLLWVNDEYTNDVPEECTRKYNEFCGKGVSIYDKDLCENKRSSY